MGRLSSLWRANMALLSHVEPTDEVFISGGKITPRRREGNRWSTKQRTIALAIGVSPTRLIKTHHAIRPDPTNLNDRH